MTNKLSKIILTATATLSALATGAINAQADTTSTSSNEETTQIQKSHHSSPTTTDGYNVLMLKAEKPSSIKQSDNDSSKTYFKNMKINLPIKNRLLALNCRLR